MYKVVRLFKDTDGTIYKPGDIYEGDASEERLHTLSTTENAYNDVFIEKVENQNDDDNENNHDDEYPKHVGGGYYELSNGEKVQGKDKAIEAEQALKSGE